MTDNDDRCPKTGKLKYHSPNLAERRRKKIKKRRGERDRMTTYHCSFCRAWHLGHDDLHRGRAA